MLTIDEIADPTGTLTPVLIGIERAESEAREESASLFVVRGHERHALPPGTLEAAMRRYGLPFDAEERVSVIGALELASGVSLRRVRHLARFDVIARDWLVLERGGGEPLCALAVTVASALWFVASRANASRESAGA